MLSETETRALAAAVLNVRFFPQIHKNLIFVHFQTAQRNSIFSKSQFIPAKEVNRTGNDGLGSAISQCQSVKICSGWVS